MNKVGTPPTTHANPLDRIDLAVDSQERQAPSPTKSNEACSANATPPAIHSRQQQLLDAVHDPYQEYKNAYEKGGYAKYHSVFARHEKNHPALCRVRNFYMTAAALIKKEYELIKNAKESNARTINEIAENMPKQFPAFDPGKTVCKFIAECVAEEFHNPNADKTLFYDAIANKTERKFAKDLPNIENRQSLLAQIAKTIDENFPEVTAVKDLYLKIASRMKRTEMSAKETEHDFPKIGGENLHEHFDIIARLARRFLEIGSEELEAPLPIGPMLGHAVKSLDKSDLKPGQVAITFIPPGEPIGDFRVITLAKQSKPHNGVPASCNEMPHSVHASIVTLHHGEPEATEAYGSGWSPVVEARARRPAMGPDGKPLPGEKLAINRVQRAPLNKTEHGTTLIFEFKDDQMAEMLALVANDMANGHLPYTSKALSDSMEVGGASAGVFDKTVQQKLVDVVTDTFHFPGWAASPQNMHDSNRPGLSCSTFVKLAIQAAGARLSMEGEFTKKLENAKKELTIENNGNDIDPEKLKQLTKKMEDFCINANTHVRGLTGVFAGDSSRVSVATLLSELINSDQVRCVGKFAPEGEPEFEEVPPPINAATTLPLPSNDILTQQKAKNQKDAPKERQMPAGF